MVLNKIKLEKLLSTCKTGDIILKHGVSTISKFIEDMDFTKFSHVGMVVTDNEYSELPCFWESTTEENLYDIVLNKIKTGPMLVNLYERLVNVEKHTYWCYRQSNRKLTETELYKFKELVSKVHSLNFPTDLQMFEEFIEGKLDIPAKEDNFFCSELLTQNLKSMQLVESSTVVNAYSPKDYSTKGHPPKFINDFNYGNETLIEL